MNQLRSPGRRTKRALAALGLTGVFGAYAWGQTPAMPRPGAAPVNATPAHAAVRKTFTKNTVFNLPIQMDDKMRANLERVCLYVKSGNADWVRMESAPATLPYFTYRVQQDGEHCFTLVTIDKSGRAVPSDVSQEPPSLRVVVDTKAPVLDVQPWTSPDGELGLRCTVIDANPNPASLKGLAKTPSGERLLQAHPTQAGVFKLGGIDLGGTTASFVAADLAGNLTTREVKLADVLAPSMQIAQHQLPPATASVEPKTVLPTIKNEPLKIDSLPAGPALVETPRVETSRVETARVEPPMLPVIPTAPLPDISQAPVPLPNVPPTLPTMVTAAASPQVQPTAPDLVPASPSSPRQIISTLHAVVDYRIDQVGPSGVGKVEIYHTGDGGQTWRRLAEDQDRRSPVEFDLPGEGVHGIRLVITNGNGFGGRPPQRGDNPTCFIEVDASSPFVQLRPIEPVVANGSLEIRWQASDKNLSAEPVSIYYRTRQDGPWQAIARGVRNDGAYRWTMPRDAAAQFYVKVEITDLAGNIARAESANPIVLDTTEPRATVVNVTGLNARP